MCGLDGCAGCRMAAPGTLACPGGGLVLAVFGSAVFYMQVLGRFMENSSSWHRVAPTAQVWQMLAVLVLTSTLIRSVYLPGTSDGWSLCAAALAAYCLGLCWQLPELGSLLTGTGDLLDLLGAAELCCTGLLGSGAYRPETPQLSRDSLG